MSDTSARANRFAFAFGSFARKGLIGGRAGVAEPAAGVLALGVAGVVTGAGCGLDAAGVGRTAGVEVGGVAGRGAGTDRAPALGVANGGTDAVAVGGVNGRGGSPPNGGRPGSGGFVPGWPAGRGANGVNGAAGAVGLNG